MRSPAVTYYADIEEVYKEIQQHSGDVLLAERPTATAIRYTSILVHVGHRININTVTAYQYILDESGHIAYRLAHSISLPAVLCGDQVLIYLDEGV